MAAISPWRPYYLAESAGRYLQAKHHRKKAAVVITRVQTGVDDILKIG